MNKILHLFSALLTITFPNAACSAQNQLTGAVPSSEQQAGSSNPTIEIGQTVRDCADCPELVQINGVGDQGQPLFVGRFELMWREYYRSTVEAGCPPPANLDGTILSDDPGKEDRYPITLIRPMDIHCFLSWLSEKTGKKYRLPTEREWTRIAVLSGVGERDSVQNYSRSRAFLRNMSSSFLGLDEEELNAMPWSFRDRREVVRHGQIAPLGWKKPDQLGLYDLIGNLPEMIADLPPNVPSTALGRKVVAAKGGGLGTLAKDLNLLKGHERFFAELRASLVGYRVVRED